MSWYTWDSSLDIKITKMNDEHKVLIDLMNQLHDQNQAQAPREALLNTFQKLANYTRQHFTEEEQYLKSIDYPELDVHKLIHARLLSQLDNHFQKFQMGDGKVNQDVFVFLKVWLNAHIKGVDMKYGEYSMNRHSIKKSA